LARTPTRPRLTTEGKRNLLLSRRGKERTQKENGDEPTWRKKNLRRCQGWGEKRAGNLQEKGGSVKNSDGDTRTFFLRGCKQRPQRFSEKEKKGRHVLGSNGPRLGKEFTRLGKTDNGNTKNSAKKSLSRSTKTRFINYREGERKSRPPLGGCSGKCSKVSCV